MARALAVVALLLAAAVVGIGGQEVASGVIMELMLKTILARDASLIGLGTLTEIASAGSGASFLNRAKGFAGADRDRMFTPESCVSMNTMSELLVSYAAIKLQRDTSFASSLDDDIDTTLAPAGLTLQNNNQRLSYKMLLTHTSTITDGLFGASIAASPNTVGSLTNFVESYFVTTGGQLNTAVFATGEPGTANVFRPARANTALMAYILERVITTRGLSAGNLKQYINDEILVPFGMSSTFFLTTDGSAPGVTPPPFYATTLTLDLTSSAVYADYFTGCMADSLSSARQIHPAWPADFMGVTTLTDIARLARALFMDTNNQVVSLLMQERILLTNAPSATPRQGQVAQGLGLMYFNGDNICSSAVATSVVNACPVTNQTTVVGHISARGASLVGFLCVNTDPAIGYVCTSGTFVHGSSNAGAFDAVFQVAGAAFQDTFGRVSVLTPPPTAPLRDDDEEEIFGVLVFFGVYLSLAFIFFGTMLIQYFLLPASVSKVTNTNAFSVGNGARLSPRRTGPGDGPFSPN